MAVLIILSLAWVGTALELTCTGGTGGAVYSTLGDTFSIGCKPSRTLLQGETIVVSISPLSNGDVETPGDLYGIPKSMDEWRITPRDIYAYNVTARKVVESPFYGDDGLLVPSNLNASGPFVISTNASTRAHMAIYAWRVISNNSEQAAKQEIRLYLARPPTTIDLESDAFYLEAVHAPALTVVARGSYPPSALKWKWFYGNVEAEKVPYLQQTVRHISGSYGSVDVKWNLVNTSPEPVPLPQTVLLNITWTPPSGFENIFDKITKTVLINPSWVLKPYVKTRIFHPDYVFCKGYNVLCDRGTLGWFKNGQKINSIHKPIHIPHRMDSKLCTMISIIGVPQDPVLQESDTYTCILRGYESQYPWLNSTSVLDNTPTQQGRPMIICLLVVSVVLAVGIIMTAGISACLWRTR